MAIVVMGVSGSGKSTLGARLAARFCCPFIEGDTFHPPKNVAKMRSGHPLTDEDRWPWLDRLGAATAEVVRGTGLAVVACSALKKSYRERLVDAIGEPTGFVMLEADREELRRRLQGRSGHYMPASLLDSQLAALEPPGAEERALTLDARSPLDRLTADVKRWMRVPTPV